MNHQNQELLGMLDLEAAHIIIEETDIYNLLILGAIFLIMILCYYLLVETKQKKIIKILKLVEKNPNKQNLLLGKSKLKEWLCSFNQDFASMTELEIANNLRSKSMNNLADLTVAYSNFKYQYNFCETNFNNILVSNAITEIKNIKNGKSVFKI
jgi:hypothetical protein